MELYIKLVSFKTFKTATLSFSPLHLIQFEIVYVHMQSAKLNYRFLSPLLQITYFAKHGGKYILSRRGGLCGDIE
jgi:hypothetical protein